MGAKSKIPWTNDTYNPWVGCHKISQGCARCYMFRDMKRYGRDPNIVVRAKPATFNAPLKFKGPFVFTCSWSDFFIEEADEWREEAWAIIKKTPHLTYQILTKRPERISQFLPYNWGEGWENVWLGITVEDNSVLERMDIMDGVNAAKKFISLEPLLESIYLGIDIYGFDWIVCGGESGSNARYMDPDWARAIRNECKEARVPFFFKQMSGREPIPDDLKIREFPE